MTYLLFETLIWLSIVGAFLALEFAGFALIRSSLRLDAGTYHEVGATERRISGVALMLVALFLFGVVGLAITHPTTPVSTECPNQKERS